MLAALSSVALGLSAIGGALMGLVVRGHLRPLVVTLWATWGGIAGGLAVSEILSGEGLNTGKTGLIAAGIAAFLSFLAVAESLKNLAAASRPQQVIARTLGQNQPEASGRDGYVNVSILRWGRRSWMSVTIFIAASLAFTRIGLVLVPTIVLILASAAVLVWCRGWPFAAALFACLSFVSVAEVILGKLVLSPLGWVGDAVPTLLIATFALTPLLHCAGHGIVWTGLVKRVGVMDLATVIIAIGAGLSWWHVFSGLGQNQMVAQVSQLGEDNDSQLLMLQATQISHSALGASAESRAVTSLFSSYFPGASLWQSAVGALTPSMSAIELYIISTAVLFSLLAGSAMALATLSARRSAVFSAFAVVAVGTVGIRLILAQYQFGFPGHLLVTFWLLTALTVVVLEATSSSSRFALSLVLIPTALAAWWTWSLAAPLLLLPPAFMVAKATLRVFRVSARVRVLALIAIAVLCVLGLAVLRSRAVQDLDTLNIDGPVSRGVPIWFALLLIVVFPFAAKLSGWKQSLEATTLVLGTAIATMGLALWQIARLGHLAYYTYKLEYLILAFSWASIAMLISSLISERERHLSSVAKFACGFVLLVACGPLVATASQTYEKSLTVAAALGPDPGRTCAAAAASSAPVDSIALAIGFGSPIANYLVTKSLMNSSESDASFDFWRPLLTAADPTTWPWSPEGPPILLIRGPAADVKETAAIVQAAKTAGATLQLSEVCPAPS
jgi:hypothetical protein